MSLELSGSECSGPNSTIEPGLQGKIDDWGTQLRATEKKLKCLSSKKAHDRDKAHKRACHLRKKIKDALQKYYSGRLQRKLGELDDALGAKDTQAAFAILSNIEDRLAIRLDEGYPVQDARGDLQYDELAIPAVFRDHLEVLGAPATGTPDAPLPPTVVYNDAFL